MVITSINCGDRFLHENGNEIFVKDISCAYDEQEARWETSIAYDVIHATHSAMNVRDVVAKARNFVIMITATDSGFVTHLSGTAPVVAPIAEMTSTVGSGFDHTLSGKGAFGSNSGATSNGNSSVAVGSGVAAPVAPPGPNPREQLFIQNATSYGLHPSDLGKKIWTGKSKRKKYKIVGANPRNWKFPILIQGPRGGVYKIDAKRVIEGLK